MTFHLFLICQLFILILGSYNSSLVHPPIPKPPQTHERNSFSWNIPKSLEQPPRWHPTLVLLPALLCDVHVRHLRSSWWDFFFFRNFYTSTVAFFQEHLMHLRQKFFIFRKEHFTIFFRASAGRFMESASTCLGFMCQAPVKQLPLSHVKPESRNDRSKLLILPCG